MNDAYSDYHNAHEKFKGDAPNLEDSYMALHTTTWYTHTALVSDRLPLFPDAKTVLLPVLPSVVAVGGVSAHFVPLKMRDDHGALTER